MPDHAMNRRRTYFIDKSFQGKFIMKFCMLIIIASLLTGLLIYSFNRHSTTVAFENLRVVTKSTSDFILPIMLQIMVAVTVLVGISTIVVTLFTSHKIAGPLYRFRVDLGKIKDGDLSFTARTRAKDQLKQVMSEFEGMSISLRESIGNLKKDWDPLRTHLLKEQKGLKAQEKKELQASIDRIDSELARFKL
ncbi:hypothetical protein ACFL0T_08155 [Candidatus Omnitrophota bacterium]